MNPIAYLIEPTSVSNTGVLRGSSLRAYEVEYFYGTPTGYGYRPLRVKSTGKVFVLDGDKVVAKRTSAKLTSKYVRSADVTSRIEDIPYYGCRLYSSPELAILAKSIAIKSRAQTLVQQLETNLGKARKALATIPDTSAFVSQHPEYLI